MIFVNLLFINFLENVLEPAIILLQNCVLCAEKDIKIDDIMS